MARMTRMARMARSLARMARWLADLADPYISSVQFQTEVPFKKIMISDGDSCTKHTY